MLSDCFDVTVTYTVTLEIVNRAYDENYRFIAEFVFLADYQQFSASML